ncbi:MAG TPA: putative DNA binding domain-containing protein [Nitrosomonas europaea]|uniref:RNA-binding domain-containing protein n=1 Tax=Nitrosomonas europaea TaxID=915 RepID=UPI002CDA2B14|nr:RNA-binding domain-containing protein [Nitrosomonas europaea]HUM74812.1 putative DNA binding domain-containing protein [Nitrosomonas europaea]
MNEQWNGFDLASLAESCDLECKAAQGRDGKGELPEDFWKSYSAMANADGGIILLGVQEKPRGTFHALGLANVERVRKALWDNLHNRKQVSVNLLGEQDVVPIEIDDKTALRIQVPRAARQHKPVHIGSNPFGGTFLRRYEGDYQADDETVRRLLAERVEDSRDERVLRHFSFNDLDVDTVAAYRNRFAAVRPGHVWSDLPILEFLERIGAFGGNREEGYDGLRIAGLLMFGRAEVIRDALPHYMVDYQERPEAKTEKRWVDRLVPDGTWSGNLYDFFRRVYQKLTADLKVPFQLKEGQRVDDSPAHEALREALVNTLIHADYSGRVSVMVVKRPDMFGFRNPGRMRIPPEIAIQGGNSDCRNRRLQTMFQLVGYGDHAGSGLPKIYTNWAGQHWRKPVLYELPEPEQTLMELRMSSLVPDEAVSALTQSLGSRFTHLPDTARLALITAHVEGMVSHDRLKQICTDHPADLTKMLGILVRDGLLVPDGSGRGTVYFLPWQSRFAAGFDLTENEATATPMVSKPPELVTKPPELVTKPPELGDSGAVSRGVYLDWDSIPEALQRELGELGLPVSSMGRVTPAVLQETLLVLCEGRYLGLRVLAQVLKRDPDDLRKRTLSGMVKNGQLQTAYPAMKDPRQAYTTGTAKEGNRP